MSSSCGERASASTISRLTRNNRIKTRRKGERRVLEGRDCKLNYRDRHNRKCGFDRHSRDDVRLGVLGYATKRIFRADRAIDRCAPRWGTRGFVRRLFAGRSFQRALAREGIPREGKQFHGGGDMIRSRRRGVS